MEYLSSNNSNSGSAATPGTTNPASDSKNRKPPSAQQLIRDNVLFLAQELERGHSEALTAFLNVMARFRAYSFGNQLLIARQKPEATRVAGIRTWNELGRRVKRGEKGIAILAPMIGKSRKKQGQESENGEANANKAVVLGFRRVFVWSEEQTEGAPVPKLEETTGEVGAYLDRLREYVKAEGITLEFDESIAPALGTATGSTIRILPGQSNAETFTTLVHELGHLILKHQERRTATTKTVRETEAEAVSFVVSKAIGLNPDSSASYIQLYFGNAALLMESLEAVQQTSATILAAIQTDESEGKQESAAVPQERVEAPAA